MDDNILQDPVVSKFDLLERVKTVYMEELGSVTAVAKRLGLPYRQTYRLVEKFRKKDARDTKYWVGLGLANYIVHGVEARKMQLNNMLRSLDGQTQPYVSSCCEGAFELYPADDTLYAGRVKCMVCNLPCNKIKVNKLAIFRLRQSLLKDMAEEEWRLVELADKMDYRKNPLPEDHGRPTKIIKNTQNIVVFDRKDENGNKEHVVEDYMLLSPMDRDRLVQRLERQILQLEEEEKKQPDAAVQNAEVVPPPEPPAAPEPGSV